MNTKRLTLQALRRCQGQMTQVNRVSEVGRAQYMTVFNPHGTPHLHSVIYGCPHCGRISAVLAERVTSHVSLTIQGQLWCPMCNKTAIISNGSFL